MIRNTRLFFCSLCVIIACTSLNIFSLDKIEEKKMLDDFHNNFKNIHRVQFLATVSSGKKIKPDNSVNYNVKYDLDKKTFKKSFQNVNVQNSQTANPLSENISHEILIDRDYFIQASILKDETIRNIIASKKFIDSELHTPSYMAFLGDFPFLKSEKFEDFFKKSHWILNQTEDKNIISFTGKYAEEYIKVYIDITKQCALKKIEYSRDYKGKNVALIGYEYDVSDFQDIDGFFVPKEFIVKRTLSSGQIMVLEDIGRDPQYVPKTINNIQTTTTVRLDDVLINPVFSENDFTFHVTIPNGTKVSIKEHPQLAFEWKDGKIVPRTDEAILALRGQRFIPYPNEPRFWLMALGIAMIILSIVLKIREYRKAKSGEIIMLF